MRHDRRQQVSPSRRRPTIDQRSSEFGPDIRQPIENIVERTGVEKQITVLPRCAVASQEAGVVIE